MKTYKTPTYLMDERAKENLQKAINLINRNPASFREFMELNASVAELLQRVMLSVVEVE